MKRWRREPDETGLARVCQSKRGAELREDGVVIASVRPTAKVLNPDNKGWYWYGLGQNTWQHPCSTMKEAKDQVMAYIKKNKPKGTKP